VEMAWTGSDADGEVTGYEVAWRDGIVQSAPSTASLEAIGVTDSTLRSADTAGGGQHLPPHPHLLRAGGGQRWARDPSPAYVGFDPRRLPLARA